MWVVFGFVWCLYVDWNDRDLAMTRSMVDRWNAAILKLRLLAIELERRKEILKKEGFSDQDLEDIMAGKF